MRPDSRALITFVAVLTLAWMTVACGHARRAETASSPRGLGGRVGAATIAPLDIDVAPDGTGLPDGSGEPHTGARLFAERCAQCHGAGLWLGRDRWMYATSIFDYVRRAMPPQPRQHLSSDDVYALTAYLLAINRVIEPSARLDRSTLPRVAMPDRADFVVP